MFKFLKHRLQKPSYRKKFRITLGILFVVLGVLGCVLPVLQGILNFSIALWLLAPYIPVLKKLLDGVYKKYPKIYLYHLKIEQKIDKWIEG